MIGKLVAAVGVAAALAGCTAAPKPAPAVETTSSVESSVPVTVSILPSPGDNTSLPTVNGRG